MAVASLVAGCGAQGADLGVVQVTVARVPLDAAEPGRTRVGKLEFRGGLTLSGPGIGGLSGLDVDDAGRMLALSDEGTWLTAQLVHDEQGRLIGLAGARLQKLIGPDGTPQLGKQLGDAESLVRRRDGSLVVGLEQAHRLWLYPGSDLAARPRALPLPEGLAAAPPNGGLEAVAELSDGRLLLLTEELRAGPGSIRGWVGDGASWHPLEYVVHGALRPTAARRLPSGDLVVLERGYSIATGSMVRVGRLHAETIGPGARLEAEELAVLRQPLTVDNFEGVACRLGARGESLLYLVADDNFSPAQRTLLMLFALDPLAEAGRPREGAAHPER